MPSSHRAGRSLRAVAAALILMAAPPAWADAPSGDWLGRMADAMRSVAYEGTLVYAYDGEMETLSVVHGVIDGREHERIRALTGEPFELIRDGETIRCLWPSSERALISQQPASLLPSGLPQGLESLPGLYQAQLEDVSRIAGRIARVIRVRASDEFRYGYRLWIDRESDMLLRSDLITPDGEVVERLMFTRFDVLDSVEPERFEPTHADREYVEYSAPGSGPEGLDDPQWQVTELPPGFHSVIHRSQAMPPRGRSVQQSVFSDGLASVSVFIEPLPEPAANDAAREPFQGPAGMGAVNAFVSHRDGHAITVVGEVPPVTVRRIARAVERTGDRAAR